MRPSARRCVASFIALHALTGAACAKLGPSAPAASTALVSGVAGPVVAERTLIVTLEVEVVVDDVDGALARIRSEVARAGGYVADGSASTAAEDRGARLVLRVPTNRAAGVREELGRLGEIRRDTEKVEDVTEQRADLGARLRNARVEEQRLLEILAQKAIAIRDVIDIEKELARVRDGIERLEAEERSLANKINLATIHVTLTSRTIAYWQIPGDSLARAARAGLRTAGAAAVCVGMAFLATAPTALPPTLLALAIVVWLRRRRSSLRAAAYEPPVDRINQR